MAIAASGTHRHVNDNAIPFFDVVPLKNVGELADLTMQLLVGQSHFITRLPFPDQRSLIPGRPKQMPVKTVFGDIQFSADEPLGERLLPLQDFLPFLLPEAEALRLFLPRIFPDSLSICGISHWYSSKLRDVRLFREVLRRLKDAIFNQVRFNVVAHRGDTSN